MTKIKRDNSWIQEIDKFGNIYFYKVVKNHCDFDRGMNPFAYEEDTKPPIHDCVIVEPYPEQHSTRYPHINHCDFCSQMHHRDSRSCCSPDKTPKGVNYKHIHYYCTIHIQEFEKIKSNDKQTTKNDVKEKEYLSPLALMLHIDLHNRTERNNELSTKAQKPILGGTGVSSGTITGKIGTDILLCEDMGSVNHGTVLPFDVIRTTNGFICKTGGATSHLAIVCRELKKPCIILPNAKELNNGDIITMNGSTGKITKELYRK